MVGLVVLVIYLFLNRPLATAIPGLAVPLSLIAAFGGMYLLGFSIDNMSLLALTLSVGLVVDDAIVVFENIIRHVEAGKKPFEAAIAGSREVAWTVVSMSLSLIAIFIPILLMGGVVGRLFNEFGIVVVLAIAASAVVSLTVTPMLAARLPQTGTRATRQLSRWFAHGFARLTAAYGRSVAWCLHHRRDHARLPCLLRRLVRAVPSPAPTFFPPEDIGELSISTQARQDISYADMVKLQQQAADIVQASPAVEHVTSSSAASAAASQHGQMFVQLKPKDQRARWTRCCRSCASRWPRCPACEASSCRPRACVSAAGLARQYQLSVQSLDPTKVGEWSDKLAAAMQAGRTCSPTSTPTSRTTPWRRRSPSTAIGPARSASPPRRSARRWTPGSANSVASIQAAAAATTSSSNTARTRLADALLSGIDVPGTNGALVPLSTSPR